MRYCTTWGESCSSRQAAITSAQETLNHVLRYYAVEQSQVVGQVRVEEVRVDDRGWLARVSVEYRPRTWWQQ